MKPTHCHRGAILGRLGVSTDLAAFSSPAAVENHAPSRWLLLTYSGSAAVSPAKLDTQRAQSDSDTLPHSTALWRRQKQVSQRPLFCARISAFAVVDLCIPMANTNGLNKPWRSGQEGLLLVLP